MLTVKTIDTSLCESYIMGKHKQVSFTKAIREPKKVRHTDVWRPSRVSSLGGSKFHVIFIDDFSKKV